MVPWFSLIFLAGNSPPAAVLSLLQAPKHKLSRQWATHPIFWISRPAPLQRVSASFMLPEFITSEATQRAVDLPDSPQLWLWNKLCGKAKVKFLLTNLEGKTTNNKSNFQCTCHCEISLGHRSQGSKSAVLCSFSIILRNQHLSCISVLLWQWQLSGCLLSVNEVSNNFLGTSVPLPPYLLI